MAMHNRRQHDNSEPKEFSEKVVRVNRVSKKTKGGNQMGFSVLMVVGDKKGRVGVSLGKAPDVLSSIKKGVRRAKKTMVRVPLSRGTIPFAIESKYGAARVYLKPAPKGSGIIAGGAVRAVVEAAGVTDIVGKILGSNNQANNVYATFEALKEIRRLVKVKDISLDGPQKVAVASKNNHQPVRKEAKKPVAKKPVVTQKAEPKKTAVKTPVKKTPAKKAVKPAPKKTQSKKEAK
jgi:small subunit ribosomal protein S5